MQHYIWRHADNLIEATVNYYTFFFIYNAYTLQMHVCKEDSEIVKFNP